MKPGAASRKKQSGVALLALLFALILVGGYAFYRSTNIGFGNSKQEMKLTLRLSKAKEALLAYAVIDEKRPGRMLCPDVIGDGVSPILTRDDCDGWVTGGPDVYTGWLPWKSLDLLESSDNEGIRFHYVTSRFFGGDRTTVPLNSETETSLRLDVAAGTASNDIVALIIATRGALDTRNADGDEYFFNGTSKNPDDNDVIAVITRQELMAAVEKRIAGEVKNCLEQHAASAPDYAYPWPAPLSNNIFKGQAKTLFGMIPTTQPGSNPDELLKQTNIDLDNAKLGFANPLSAANANVTLAVVQQLQSAVAYAKALYDRLYIVAIDLYNKSGALASSFDVLDRTLGTITKNSAAFSSGAAGIPSAIELAQPSLEAFRISLANSGFDVFLMELETQNAKLQTKITLAAANPADKLDELQTQANVFKSKLLANSITPNSELSALLSSNLGLATVAVDTAKAAIALPSDNTLVASAIASASSLVSANQTLDQTVQAIRLNVDPLAIDVPNEKAKQALDAYLVTPTPSSISSLALSLASIRTQVASITRGSNAVMSAKAAALLSLDNAISTAIPGANPSAVQSTSNSATAQASSLILAMQNNGDNIAQATLKAASDLLVSSRQTPPANLAAGLNLKDLGKLVIYWSDTASVYAKSIAQKARKKPDAVTDSDISAYVAAQQLLNSLDGDTGTIELLQKAIEKPSDTTTLDNAQAALNKTKALLDALDTKSTGLESTLQAGLADAATPTKWYGSACTILQPPIGSNTWWVTNNWANYIFYQTSEHTRSLPTNEKCVGKLKVNGTGEHCVVALSAGKPLAGQTRSSREVAQYLDDSINADVSRNGDAQNPSATFSNKQVSAKFNDRLAY